MGQMEEALVLFNQLRKDPLLLVSAVHLLTFVHFTSLHFQMEDSIFSMIEICLNLDEVIG